MEAGKDDRDPSPVIRSLSSGAKMGRKEPSETTEKVGVCGRGVRQKAVGSLFFMFSPHFLSLDAHYFLSMGQIAGMTGVFLPSSCHFYLFYGSHPFQIDRYCGKHGL